MSVTKVFDLNDWIGLIFRSNLNPLNAVWRKRVRKKTDLDIERGNAPFRQYLVVQYCPCNSDEHAPNGTEFQLRLDWGSG